jgi:hypothetical protein
VTFQRAEVFTPNQAEDFDLVVCNGLRLSGREVYDTYTRLGVPAIVVDSGHLRRDRGYHRLTLGDHTWTPAADCPHDRFAELDLDVAAGRRHGDYILIAGQQSNDSAHGMGRSAQIKWLGRVVTRLWDVSDRPIVWRPHPADIWEFSGADEVHHPEVTSLGESLAGAHAVVTYNSTTGLDALMAGVPVWSCADSIYDELAHRELETIETGELPCYADRVELLWRVAYTQWQVLEIQGGAPFRFLWSLAQGLDPFAGDTGWATKDFDALASLVSARVRSGLSKAGLWSTEALREATNEQLMGVRGVGPATAARLKEAAA